MLKEYKSMTQEEMYTLVHEIYIEGCMENAREKYPDATDLTTAIQQEEDSFVCFLQDFFTLPENTYCSCAKFLTQILIFFDTNFSAFSGSILRKLICIFLCQN